MNDNLKPSVRFTLRADLVVEEVDDEIVVLDLEGNQYFGLNEVGWMIWQAIEEEKSLGEIAEMVAGEFEVEEERAREDAAAFVGQLIEAGLAERA